MLRASNRPILAYFDAIKNLRLRQVALILKAGYDPNLMVNARGQNGLQFMVNYYGATDAHFRLQVPLNRSAYLSIAKLLLDSGLDPNVADLLTDETVLFDAIRYNDKEMVALLLNYADLAARNKNGETPLMCAARFGTKPVVRMILEHLRHLEMDGYFLRQRNRFGLTALELARAENLEAAKVLTKHLITFGHHTNAVLARSSSHHQLLAARAAALPAAYNRAGYSPRVAAAAALGLDPDSGSDFESELLAAGPAIGYPGHLATRRRGLPMAPVARLAGGYDPKAAEFNQYLLEHQELANSAAGESTGLGGSTGGGVGMNAALSDDEDYLGSAGPVGGSGLTRSRSCMLGPQAGKSKKYQVPGSSGAGGSGKNKGEVSGKSNWDDGANRGSMS